MGINTNKNHKFHEAYKDLKPIIRPLLFAPDSEYFFKEEWREVMDCFVPGVLPGAYFISTHGRVYTNIKSPKYPEGGIMSHSINDRGYHQINLMSVDGRKIGIKITRLVMLHFAFFPGCEYYEVDHLDGNKDNNCLWNFEWVTPKENTRRSIEYGRRSECYNDEYPNMPIGVSILLYCYSLTAFNMDDYERLSCIYGVSIDYIYRLQRGEVKPYIKRNYEKLEKMLRDNPEIDDFLLDRWNR